MSRAAGWLAERLGLSLSDPALLDRALTHRSHGSTNNERLEYLGDPRPHREAGRVASGRSSPVSRHWRSGASQ